MFPNLTTNEVVAIANKVGRRVAGEYPGIDADDIASAALLELARKAASLKSGDEAYVYKVIYNDAIRYAAKKRYDEMLATATFIYRPKEVRALLSEAYFDPTMWDVPTAKDDYLLATISQETIGISLIDLQEAWGRLKAAYRDVLIRRFREEDKSVPAMQVTRAIEALTRYMNSKSNRVYTDHGGPGGRQAMSNSRAQYVTSSDAGHEQETFRRDAVSELHSIRSNEPAEPAGTFYDWTKEVA